jgi:hypothetical protein
VKDYQKKKAKRGDNNSSPPDGQATVVGWLYYLNGVIQWS